MPRDGFAPISFKQIAPAEPEADKDDASEDEQQPAADTQNDHPPLSGDAAKLARLTINLRDILREETDHLHQRRTRDAQALHGPKNRLMNEYKAVISQLKVNDRTLGAEDSPQRAYIRSLTDQMRDALKDHARLVLRLKAVSEGLIKSIGEEVAKKNRPVMNYGKSARVTAPTTVAPTSLALNQLI